ncbi:hypothetical protein COL91_02525 [Bacillus pseudomycoides]|nr:hypothetical protein CN679_17515 [Bacillus pseudomycoides]PGA94046.1 hypothetical protein COL91_02525 [Bacillus pseudomycoides]PHF49535.1 hypothetical protein COF72_07615 [Bacillus pseudomycoides]
MLHILGRLIFLLRIAFFILILIFRNNNVLIAKFLEGKKLGEMKGEWGIYPRNIILIVYNFDIRD